MTLKILFLSHQFYPDIGGIEVCSEMLANAFSEAGHEVRLLTWSADPTGKTFPFAVERSPKIRTLLKAHAWADVVFENNPCLQLAWPNLLISRPSVVALHTWLARTDGKLGWQDQFKFKWLKRAHNVIACSDAVRKRCWPASVVIENAYREDAFRILPEVSRTSDFVFLGRLVSDKGADLAIQAFHQLLVEKGSQNSTSKKLALTIIGDGPERERLASMVSELGLETNTTFTGVLRGEALVKCLNRHRFLLVPSRWEEPFGMVALEGMACGCVPIVSDGGGLPDAVGKAGITFQRGDVDALKAAIRRVLDNPALEKQLREAAPMHLAAHRSSEVSKQYMEVIERVIRSPN